MINIENLIKYYIECIEIESLEEFSFPSFKYNQTFINLPLKSEWSKQSNNELKISPPPGFKKNLALGGAITSIYYGWPIYAHQNITQNGKPYSWIEPVFLLKVEYEIEDSEYHLALLKEWPKINNRILKKYAQTIEERIQIIDTLGLSDAKELTPNGLIEYWKGFVELYPNTEKIEEINEEQIITSDLTDIQNEGFYNRAFLITASAPRYSRQLLRELRELKKPEKQNKIYSTSLGALIATNSKTNENKFTLSQISLLNRSQRKAVNTAFSSNLTVITGPPGTGKSQVVLNILANAFENNLTVLFTSKNNKAVDVVCERIINKINFPINLRLGAKTKEKDYTIAFLDLLDSVLAGGDSDTIETEYNRSKNQFEIAKEKYFNLLNSFNEIVKTRNEIDELDQIIEGYEKRIDKQLIESAKEILFKESNLIEKAKTELEVLKREQCPFIYKFKSLFSVKYPYKKLHYLCLKSNELVKNILNWPSEVATEIEPYSEFLGRVSDLYDYIKIYNQIYELRENLSDNDINQLSNDVENAENIFINSTIKYYAALGRKRMLDLSMEARQGLTNYYAVIRQLSGEYPGNRTYSRLKGQQEKLFRKVSAVLPVWSVTNLSAGGHFPFIENMFDLVVIDEASQSDIASAFPLLYRAKNAVIIGDPQQLSHITSIGIKENNRLMDKYNMISEDINRFSYTPQSLYHCALGAIGKNNVTLLNEHYRSHFSIIEFSNREWYAGSLDIRTNYDNLIFPPDNRNHLEWINTIGNTIRPHGRSAFNEVEANRVLEILTEIFKIYSKKQPSIGIVTPFAAQAGYFRDHLIRRYNEDFIKKHFLIADTAHKFQGDERDIVIFSPVISTGTSNNSNAVGFLKSTSNLFNVSITRARSILWVVGDKNKCTKVGIPYLNNFVEYIEHQKYKNIDLPYSGFQSPWEKRFYEALVAEGFKPQKRYPAGPYFIDIAIIQNKVKIAMEADGARWHTTLTGERLERDTVRDRNLRCMGWDVCRFWVHDLKYDMGVCINNIKKKLSIT